MKPASPWQRGLGCSPPPISSHGTTAAPWLLIRSSVAPLWLSFDIGDGGPCSAGWTDPAEPAESAGMGGRRSKGGGCHKAGKSCFALLCSQPACTQPLWHLESTRHNATKGGHALKQQNNNKNPKQKKIHLSASPNPWGETGVGRNRPKEPQLEPCRAGRLPVLLAFPGGLLAAVSVSHRWPHQCGAVGFWDASGCTRSTRTAVLWVRWRSALGEGNKTEGSCQNEWV